MRRFVPYLAAVAVLAGCGQTQDAARPLALDAVANASLPRLSAGPDRRLWLSWVEDIDAGAHRLRFAKLDGDVWSPPATVAEGRDWFVNWADFPSVVPLGADLAAAHWLVKRPGGTYAYDVAIALSTDGGAHWSMPITPHDDASATEHGFASLFPAVGGEVGAVWLDGRNMAPADAGSHDGGGDHAGHGGGMSLRFGIVSPITGVVLDQEIDPLTCDCCQTGAAVSDNGVVVVYRDRDKDEIRDVSFARFETGTWSETRTLAADGWHIEGCPVNGPAIDARDKRVVVAWFTGAGTPRVRASWSEDGGRSFSTPMEIDSDRAMGRVDVTMVGDDDAVVSWMSGTDGDGAEIRYRRLHADGTLGRILNLESTSAARSAGFPQIAAGGDGLVFAWTRTGEAGGVATATVTLPR